MWVLTDFVTYELLTADVEVCGPLVQCVCTWGPEEKEFFQVDLSESDERLVVDFDVHESACDCTALKSSQVLELALLGTWARTQLSAWLSKVICCFLNKHLLTKSDHKIPNQVGSLSWIIPASGRIVALSMSENHRGSWWFHSCFDFLAESWSVDFVPCFCLASSDHDIFFTFDVE